jgi:hypothetical protein
MSNVTTLRTLNGRKEREAQLQALAVLFKLGGYLDDLGMHEAAVKLGKAMDPLLEALGFTPEEVSDASRKL